jgi:hypothetical protein
MCALRPFAAWFAARVASTHSQEQEKYMIRFTKLAAAVICSLPLIASAQTPSPNPKITPADAPRTNLERQQTQTVGDAPKYGQAGSDIGNVKNRKDDAGKPKVKKVKKMKKTADTPPDATTTK